MKALTLWLTAAARRWTLVLTATCLSQAAPAYAVQFDLETLKARGLNPALATQFSGGTRFLAGPTVVNLKVNGRSLGQVPAVFSDDGALCFSQAFLKAAGLQSPDDAGDARRQGRPPCDETGFLTHWPNTVVTLLPGALAVEIVAPAQALAAKQAAQVTYVKGGLGAMLNYDVMSGASRFQGGGSRYSQVQTETGLNAGDWILRSNDFYSSYDGAGAWRHVDAYAQRTFEQQGKVFQAGQINIQGGLFGGVPLLGAQVFPETALWKATAASTMVSGIARTQARVEVRQNGLPLYSTVVPPGEFTLTEVVPRWSTYDLQVTVHESDGEVRSFIVPAASLHSANVGPARGLSASVGKLRGLGSGSAADSAPVASAEYEASLGPAVNLAVGGLGTSNYGAAGVRVGALLPARTSMSAQVQGAGDRQSGLKGAQWSLSSAAGLPYDVSLSASYQRRSAGYRDVLDSGDPKHRPLREGEDTVFVRAENNRIVQQMSGGLSWGHRTLGGMSLSVSESTTQRNDVFRRGMLSWGKSFDRVNVSLAVERDLGSSAVGGGGAAYLSVSLPLGRNSVSAGMQRRDGRDSYSLSTSAPIDEHASYALSATQDPRGASYSGSLNATPRYAQAGLSASAYSGGSSHTLRLRGGVVAHDAGVTLSPHRVQDTYAIASVGGESGVKLTTPGGTVWTDPWGRAVIPALTPFSTSRIQVATPSLARNVDLINGLQEIEAGRGSVSKLTFDVSTVRRILLTALDSAGAPVQKGASVIDAKGGFVTLAGGGGQIFLPDAASAASALFVDTGGTRCRLDFTLRAEADREALYERVDAVCVAVS